MADERREHARIASNAAVHCRAPASPRRVRLVDVSRSGCRVRALDGAAVPYGATVLLDFARADRVSGQVVWAEGQTAGVRFDHALSHAQAVAVGLEEDTVVAFVPRAEPAGSAPARDSLLAHWLRRLLRRAA